MYFRVCHRTPTIKNLEITSCLRENQIFVVVVVGYPAPSEGWGMTEDHGAPEAGKLPRVWTRGRTETESRQRVSGAKSP